MFSASSVFLANYNATKKIVVNQGGTSAGKTYSIMQVLFTKAISNPNVIITVVGSDIPMLKKGAMRDAQKIIRTTESLQNYIKEYNKTDRIFYFKNGSMMEFSSFEDELDARGGRRDYLYINECNAISYMVYWQLAIRTSTQIFLDYNPSFRFYVHEKILPLPEAQLIISDHRHNPFLPTELHNEIENIKDPEMFKVYARGLTGKTKGAIFNFKKVDRIPTLKVVNEDGSITEQELPFGFGMDIGYTTDKTTIVKVYLNGKDHYYQELLYKSNDEIQNEINENELIGADGLPQTVEGYIKQILIDNGMTSSTMLWGDHDKNISSKMRRMGLPYRMARKGPNSVVASISSVKRYNGYYFNSPILESELMTYVWQTAIDQISGDEVSIGQPVDGMPDHCFVGNTMIETNDGFIKMKDVKVGDLVRTSEGFKKVLIKWDNGMQRVNTYSLQFDTFIVSLTCTPNHLIKTNAGWIQISQLQSGMTVSLSSFSMENHLNYNHENAILIAAQKECTSMYGSSLTEKLKRAFTFTIRIVTRGIIGLTTLNASQAINILQNTVAGVLEKTRNGIKSFVNQLLLAQTLGRKHWRVERARDKRLSKPVLVNGIYRQRNALHVENYLSLQHTTIDFAPTAVNQNTEGFQGLTMKIGHVRCAELGLQPINIARPQFAVKNVQVTEAGKQEVYDLTVDGVHEYYANGVLVHNCIAAIRYFEHSYSLRFAG